MLLRRAEDGRFHQVGAVSARRGKVVTLVLEDGTTTQHELSPEEITPLTGSFNHLVRVNPSVVTDMLAEHPERVFKQLLHDSEKPMSAKDLKGKLRDFPGALVDKAWRTAKPLIDADGDVQRHGAKQVLYAVRDSLALDLLDLLPPQPPQSQQPQRPDVGGVVPGGSETQGAEPREYSLEPFDGSSRVSEPDSSPADMPAAGEAATTSLVARLAGHAPGLKLASIADVSRRPMAVADLVRSLSASEREALASDLSQEEGRLLQVVVGPPKSAKATQPDVSTPEELHALLAAALDELRRLPHEKKRLKATLLTLVDRATAAGAAEPALIVRIASVMADAPVLPAGVDRCLGVLAEQVRSMPAPDPRSWDVVSLSRAASNVPFDRDGGRSRFVAALHAHSPEEARQPRWWERTSVSDLAEAARGRLSSTLEDEVIANAVVAPLVNRLLDETGSRSGVSVVWSMPLALARHVDGRRMARLIADVGARDETTASWLRALSNAETVSALEQRASTLSKERDEARREAAAARTEADRLSLDLRRASDQLAAMRNAEVSERGSRDRQVRLDLLRTLSVLAAQVKQSEQARSDAALLRQVDHACRREGLQPVDAPGDVVIFDPARHEPLTPGLSAENAAIVVRGGYTWADGDETAVLVKAQVVAG